MAGLYQRAKQQEELFKSLLRSIPNPVAIYDLEGRATYINPAFTETFGYSPSEVLGRQISFVPDEEAERSREEIQRVLAGIPAAGFETRRRCRDGRILDVILSSSVFLDHTEAPAGIIVILRDISHRVARQKALSLSEAKYRSLFEDAPEAIILADRTDRMRFLDMNDKACDLFGLSKENLIGLTPCEVSPPFQPFGISSEECIGLFTEAALAGKLPIFEWTHAHSSGREVCCEVRLVPFPDAESNIMRASLQDITARKKLEAEKESLRTQLIHAQKLEAVGTLASGIAHDFNNILGVILGYTELCLERAAGDPRMSKNLGEVLTAAGRAKGLVNQILTFCRQGEGKKVPVDLHLIVKEGLSLLRQMIPANIRITPSLDRDSGKILGDPTRIHQVLMNLVTNAHHAIGERAGEIKVGLLKRRIAQPVAGVPKELPSGSYALLIVSDTGEGIPQEMVPRIFEPFFTTKKVGEGTGMGLSVLHGIVRDYGGAVGVESSVGAGTTFTVYLPLAEVSETEAATPPPAPACGSGRILLVDDEKSLIHVTGLRLKNLGYSVEAFNSPMEALEVFKERSTEFDLLLCDYAMPGMTGLSLAQEALALRPEVPVMLYSGFIDRGLETKGRAIGVRKFLAKPASLEALAKGVREALTEKRL